MKYLESLYKTPSSYSMNFGAAAFIQKYFPESHNAMNAVFHRPLADLQRLASQSQSKFENDTFIFRKAESLPEIKPKCLCCEFNHEPKLFVILQDGAFELNSNGIFTITRQRNF